MAEDIFSEENTLKSEQDKNIPMTINVLNPEDMLGKLPPDILIPNKRFVLAGGSVRRWFSGEKEDSDFDYFMIGDQKTEEFVPAYYEKTYENLVNVTYHYKDKTIQIIKLKYTSIEDLFNHFDFCHCCFAYDGSTIYATEDAIISTLRKHLKVNKILKGFELDSLRRAFKYQKAGYTPCLGTIRDLALSFSQLTETDINKIISISPSGGKRKIIRLD
jgi:hypothetical protein